MQFPTFNQISEHDIALQVCVFSFVYKFHERGNQSETKRRMT